MRWADIVGQDAAVRFLRSALGAGRLPHAILLWGPAGVGKRSAAGALAAAALCAAAADEACGACPSCREFGAGVHPDWIAMAVEDDARAIRIDAVRDLMGAMNLRPVRGRRRIALVPRAERLGEDAQNALLKNLEEPAGAALWIMTAEDPSRLLGTVRSRAAAVRFGRIPGAALAALVERRGLASGADARALADAAEGSFGRAQELCSDEWRAEREFVETQVLPRVGAGASAGPALALALSSRAAVRARRNRPAADRAGDGDAPAAKGGGLEESRRPALRMLAALVGALRARMRSRPAKDGATAAFWSDKVKVVLESDGAIRQNVNPELALAAAAAGLAASGPVTRGPTTGRHGGTE